MAEEVKQVVEETVDQADGRRQTQEGCQEGRKGNRGDPCRC